MERFTACVDRLAKGCEVQNEGLFGVGDIFKETHVGFACVGC